MYQIYFYVPREYLDQLLDAMFLAGGGAYGNYDRCCWITEGQEQFRPLSQSNPHLGTHNKVSQVPEVKVEMVCSASKLESTINQLKTHHPYEQVAYGVIKLEPI